MNSSTSFVDQLRQDFHNNPIQFRVLLPDGSHAIVRSFEDMFGLRLYKVQGCTPRGRYVAMADTRKYYLDSELKLFYFSATVNLEDAA